MPGQEATTPSTLAVVETASRRADRVRVLETVALAGGEAERRAALGSLARLDGRGWLTLDATLRRIGPQDLTPYGPDEAEPWRLALASPDVHDLTAVVGSMLADGRLREPAVAALAGRSGPAVAAALALRALDHIASIRAAARSALGPLGPDDALAALGVSVAAGRRLRGPSSLDVVLAAADRTTPRSELVDRALANPDRGVRRWAVDVAEARDLLPPERLLGLLRTEPDQQLVARCTDLYLATASPDQAVALLASPRVTVRVRAFDAAHRHVADDTLLGLTVDRAAAVRERARWQAGVRGLDVTGWALARLDADARTPSPAPAALSSLTSANPPTTGTPLPPLASATTPTTPPSRLPLTTLTTRERAACLETLVAAGGTRHLDVVRSSLTAPEPRVRAVAVGGTALLTHRDDAIGVARTALLDPSPRVAAAAARALARVWAHPRTVDDAWASPQPWSRRAAWTVCRAAGGWHRIEADLRAALDPDPGVAARGRGDVTAWLAAYGTGIYEGLEPDQRERLAVLLRDAVHVPGCRRVATVAGIDMAADPPAVGTAAGPLPVGVHPPARTTASVPAGRRWWRWW